MHSIPDKFPIVIRTLRINIAIEIELKSLSKAAKSILEAKNFVIITYNEEKTISHGSIEIHAIPIWKMLARGDSYI